MTPELVSKRLYIVDLAQRQLAMECGSTAMHALTYRVLAKLLRQAAAGLPEPALHQLFATLSANSLALLDEALQARHFDQHGTLCGTLPDGVAGSCKRACSCRRAAETCKDAAPAIGG